MSRNSKNARQTEERKKWSVVRKSGSSGPKKTIPKHGKEHRMPRNKVAPKVKEENNTTSIG